MNRVDEGMTILQQVLDDSDMMSKEYRKALLDLALVYARLGHTEKSAFYIRLAKQLGVSVVPSSLCFIEASLLAGEREKADKAMHHLLSQITWVELITILEKTSPNTPGLPLNYSRLLKFTKKWLTQQQKQ
ncbi:MAG: hypothetical protein D3909_05940 [Candidatus Electrothrix sp. ATG1]|nr:hypothetical protein [Candidatus Electrothrix sp. ATG1]